MDTCTSKRFAICTVADIGALHTVHLVVGEAAPGERTREIEGTYTAGGRPLALVDYAIAAGSPPDPVIETVLARFDSSGTAVGFHRTDRLAALRAHQLGGLPPLGVADARRARALAAWVWTHRCHPHH